jgi:isocitrate lyase
MNRQEQIKALEAEWADSPRWKGIERTYSAEDVVKLRGTVNIEHTLARQGAEKMWRLIHQEDPLCGLGALTGNQAIDSGSAGWPESHLLLGLAGCRRWQQRR